MADPQPVVRLPQIPVGLATKIGQVVAAVFALIALVSAVIDGDHSQETITSLIMMGLTVFTLMGGRYAQSVALLRDAPSPTQDDHSDEVDLDDDVEVPGDDELARQFPGDPPEYMKGDPTVPPGLQPEPEK